MENEFVINDARYVPGDKIRRGNRLYRIWTIWKLRGHCWLHAEQISVPARASRARIIARAEGGQ